MTAKIFHFNTFKRARKDYGSVRNYRETLKLLEQARSITDEIFNTTRRENHERDYTKYPRRDDD